MCELFTLALVIVPHN